MIGMKPLIFKNLGINWHETTDFHENIGRNWHETLEFHEYFGRDWYETIEFHVNFGMIPLTFMKT